MALTPEIAAIITAKAQQYGQDPAYMLRQAEIESSGNPNAQARGSSAGGLFQFIDSTAKQYGLNDKFDPVAASDAAARLARDNGAVLSGALGRAPSPGELYLAHQQGAGGARGLLTNPDAPAASIVGNKAVLGNGGSLDDTAAQFASRWTGKFDGSGPTMTMPGSDAKSGHFGVSGIEPSAAPAAAMAMPPQAAPDTSSIDIAKLLAMVSAAPPQAAQQPAQPAPQPRAVVQQPPARFDAQSFYALFPRRRA